MKAIDLKDFMEDIVDNVQLRIDDDYLNDVCKIASKNNTCRYILMGPEGHFVCAKHTKMRQILDELVKKESIEARGNNCQGLKS
ncbi:MAG: hypothetical protein ACOC56_03760 [Atribacterota bacterium]